MGRVARVSFLLMLEKCALMANWPNWAIRLMPKKMPLWLTESFYGGVYKKKVYIAIYKPRGYLSDYDENFPRPTVLDLIDVPEQLFPVGRLDFDSEGLVLMTNDGELANRLTHPRYEHEKSMKFGQSHAG